MENDYLLLITAGTPALLLVSYVAYRFHQNQRARKGKPTWKRKYDDYESGISKKKPRLCTLVNSLPIETREGLLKIL